MTMRELTLHEGEYMRLNTIGDIRSLRDVSAPRILCTVEIDRLVETMHLFTQVCIE